MPLFALEQIVLLSFAERERAADARRLHVCARARKRETRARAYETGNERREEKSATKSTVLVPLCFFRSVLPLLAMCG